MAFADQYVVYGYWDTGYCVGDVTPTEASASIDGVCSVVSSAIRLRLADASITSTVSVNSSCIRIRDFSGSISASATITANAIRQRIANCQIVCVTTVSTLGNANFSGNASVNAFSRATIFCWYCPTSAPSTWSFRISSLIRVTMVTNASNPSPMPYQ